VNIQPSYIERAPYLPLLSNRDGKKLSPWSIQRGLRACYGLSAPLALFLTFLSFAIFKRIRCIDLHEIGKHDMIEHDASLVHLDTPDGEEFAPTNIDQNLVDELMNDVQRKEEGSDGTESLMNIDDVARARIRREKACRPINKVHQEIARGEMAIILGVWETISKDRVGIPTKWVREWIGHETLPDGWRPTHKQGLWNTIQRSKAIRMAVEEMRKGTDKTSDSNINDEKQTPPSKKSSPCTIF